MINAWSLAYDVLNGTLDENFPIMTKDNKQKIPGRDVSDIAYGGLYPEHYASYYQPQAEVLNISLNSDVKDTFTDAFDHMMEGMESGGSGDMPDPFSSDPLSDNDDQIAHHINGLNNGFEKPEPNLEYKSQKYEEDAGIKDLKDYISSTYSGHYTSEQNNTQTLDLIQSVGDAESFCRSNAIKYLARYDKKGQAKRDILKAMHYCLLLYYFSGHTNNETPTRGYETF